MTTADLMCRIMECDPMVTVHGHTSTYRTDSAGICRFCVVYIDSAGNTVVLQCRTADSTVIDRVRSLLQDAPFTGVAVVVSGYLQLGAVPILTATLVSSMEVF